MLCPPRSAATPRPRHLTLQAVKHSTVSEYIQKVISEPGKFGIKLKADICEYAYLPVVASGGAFELRVGAITDDSRLHDGVVMLHIGGKYNSECTNICRTLFFHPTSQCAPLAPSICLAACVVRAQSETVACSKVLRPHVAARGCVCRSRLCGRRMFTCGPCVSQT